MAQIPLTRGRQLKRYLLYPRILLTLVLCIGALVLHVVFGVYVWVWR